MGYQLDKCYTSLFSIINCLFSVSRGRGNRVSELLTYLVHLMVHYGDNYFVTQFDVDI